MHEISADQTSPSRIRPLSEPASFLLDLIRLSAALLVVIAHSGHPEFFTGFRDRQILGDIAVPVFFVLSGFVIRYVTRLKEHTLRLYLIDRASRMYSVMLPAAALTLLLASVTAHLAPAYYTHFFSPFQNHLFTRLTLNLLFLSQSWSHSIVFFIDSPFWSLSYECLYYLAYGFAFFLRGWTRFLALILWAAISGPQILLLLPVWVSGCVLFDLFQATRNNRGLQLAASVAAALLMPAGYFLTRARNPLVLLHIAPYRATTLALGIGLIAAAAIFLLLLLSNRIPSPARSRWFRRFRHLADGTFAIYLMHYPLMVAANAVGLFHPATPVRSLLVFVLICLSLIFVARSLDRFKVALRTLLHRLFPPPYTLPAARPVPHVP